MSQSGTRPCVAGMKPRARVYLLTIRRFTILALGAVDEGGRFGVKTVQTLRLLVHKRVVLGHELPSNFRGNDVVVDCWRSHDEDCAVAENREKSDGKKLNERVGRDLRGGGRIRGGMGEGWTTGTTLRRGVYSRVAEKLLM